MKIPLEERFIHREDSPSDDRYVVLEDDGEVAYAYLFKNGRIVGDVWLYNVGDAPPTVNWHDRDSMPFRNPEQYCLPNDLPRLTSSTPVSVQWSETDVMIFIDGLACARMEEGSKPGWSRTARIEGPLAKPLRLAARE
jgi:hypothetical protein